MLPFQLSASLRRVFVVSAALLAVVILVISGHAQAPASLPPHIIVKVKVSFASNLESALPLQTMELVAGNTGSATIDTFLSKYSAHKIRPVYVNIVREKKQQGMTDLQIATVIRQKYSKRGNRLHASFQPPEISRTYILELDPAAQPNQGNILQALRADSNVEFAEPDHLASTTFTPNDPYFSSYGSWGQPYDDLWGIKKIGAPAAWDTTAGAGIIVAVIDTGIDYNHPDIAANMWTNPGEIPNNGIDDDNNGYVDDVMGWDFIGSTYTNPTQSNNPIDHFGHGTHVAGTIAAVGNNGIGVIGVAWQAKVMAVKGLDDSGVGLDSTLGPAIIYAANNGADVISNSWAGSGTSQTIADAMSYAYNLGAVIVAAAGNSNADARNFYPANLPQVITVAATDHNDTIASFSNWGDKIDVAAPGVDILSLRAAGTSMGTPVDANYTRADGTSMATPHVSGLAALVLAQHSSYSNEDVRQVIRVSATSMGTPGFDQSYGYGRINAAGATTVVDAVEAKILSPSDGTVIQGPTTISGVARGSVFAQYKLEYGAGHTPATWTLIQSGNAAVNGGAFGTFDPSTIPDGTYVIRLTAYDTLGNAFVDRIELKVKYLSITSPVPPLVPTTSAVFKPGAQVAIVGTATGASLQDFRIDWAEGFAPTTGWRTTGITLSGGGVSPISNGQLGTWDTSSITQADYYTIRLSVDDSGFTSITTTIVYLEPSLLSPNWPTWLDAGTYWSSGIVPVVDGAGNQTLALASLGTTNRSEYRTFSPDGSTQTNTSLTYYGTLFQPSVGDLDGIPGDESVVTDVLTLKTFKADGTFTTITPQPQVHLEYSQVILEDLNNDSLLETIVLGQNIQNQTALIFAYLRNGQLVNANFPAAVADLNGNMTTHTFGSRLVVGDINGDGNKEILVMEGTSASTFTPRLFHNDGTPLSWAAQTQNGWPDQMVLADLDHNGTLETIYVCGCNSRKELHVLQPDGTERAGWPVILSNTPYTLSFIAVGDLKRDGHDEIVADSYNQLYVLKPDGTSFSTSWPYTASLYGQLGPIALADINGDGLPEIITSEGALTVAPNPLVSSTSASAPGVNEVPLELSTQIDVAPDGSTILRPRVDVSAQFSTTNEYNAPVIEAFRSDRSIARTWNILGAKGNQPDSLEKLTVGDFNNDGITDIAVTYSTIMGGGVSGWLKEGVATVLTTGSAYNPAANDWPMIYQNPRNTAIYRPLLYVNVTSPASGASVSGAVTLVASAPDKAATPTVQFQLDGVNLGTPIASAPYTMSWDTSTASFGTHVITVSASDSASNTAVSPAITVAVTAFSVTPGSLNLGSAPIGSTTAAQTVTLTNPGQTAYSLTAVNVAGDFAETDNCVGSLGAGTTCSIHVTFTPTVRGAETGSLSVSGNFPGSSPTVSLLGTGQLLQGTVSPTSLTFGSLPLYNGSTNQVTYSNTGDLPITITAISTTGDFQESGSCNSPLAPGASCILYVTFVPTAAGLRTGTLTISGNVSVSVSLSGTGEVGQVSVSPTSLAFGNQNLNTTSAPQTITVTSTGSVPATITGWSNPGAVAVTNNCPYSLASGSSCTFTLAYTPTVPGPLNGSFIFSGSFQNSPASVSLSGTGIGAAAQFSPYSLTFGNQSLNSTSAPQGLTLFNTGNAPLTISRIAVTGDFAQTNNCGSSVAGGSNCTIYITFQPTATGTRSGTLQLNANVTSYPATIPLTGTGIAVPAPSFSVSSLTFASQRVNTTSPAQSVTLSNTGSGALTISSINFTGSFGDFAQSNNCGPSLAGGATCVINVTFTPITTGTRTGTLTVSSNAPSQPSAAISGSGVASVASLSQNSLGFAPQFVGTTSASQTVTLTNTGTATLNISSISASGDFAQTNTCGTAVAANANCSINVTFTPTLSGNRSGTLSITDDDLGTNPQTVSLGGTGTAPALSFSPSGFSNFGTQRVNTTSPAQTMTITNNGNATLSISGFTASAGFNQTNNCGSTLAVGANCTVNVTFTPTAQGSVSGTLTLNSNLPGTPPSFSLTGTGGASAAALSVNTLAFGSQLVGTASGAQSVTLTNTGTLSLNISSFSASGDFTQSNNCPASLAVAASCTINVTFTPTASGTRTGALSIVDDAIGGSAQSVALSGTGYTLSAAFSPSSLSFVAQRVGTTSSAKNVILTNTGTGTLSISGLVVSGDFTQTNNCPASLGAGATCTVSVVFVPAARGTRTGSLTLNSNATGTPPSVSLSGTGIGPVASLSPSSLTFAAQHVSSTSSAQTVTLSNTGDAILDISSIAASGDFAETNNCASTLAAGAQCTVNVTFTPTAAGTRTGALTITDDASNGNTQTVALTGTGVDFSLSVSPASLTVTHGSSVTTTVTVSALGGSFNSSVSLACSSALPKGLNCSFSPGGVTPGNTSANSTLKISTSGGGGATPPGSYVITVRGTSSNLQRTTTVTLQVN